MKVHIYRNLNKNCWSVRHKGKIIQHCEHLFLKNCTYHVQKAGHKKVNKEMRKNVHAYVKGELTAISDVLVSKGDRISYNPYKFDYFYNVGNYSKIESSKLLYFNEEGEFYEINREN